MAAADRPLTQAGRYAITAVARYILGVIGLVVAFETLHRSIAESVDPFNIILLDPPYDVAPDHVLAVAGDMIADSGIVILEHARKRPSPQAAGRLVRNREVIAGDSALAFYAWPL